MSDISGVSGIQLPYGFDPNDQVSVSIQMSRIFDQIDTSNSGYITPAELNDAYMSRSLPNPLNQTTTDAIFARFDPNNTGRISKEDFLRATQLLADAADHKQAERQHHHGGHHHVNPTDADTQAQPSAWNLIGQLLSKKSPD